jgi:hypothetical protein
VLLFDAIFALKSLHNLTAHELRTAAQRAGLKDLHSSLASDQCLVHYDWGMKVLASYFAELMAAYFGKEGLIAFLFAPFRTL